MPPRAENPILDLVEIAREIIQDVEDDLAPDPRVLARLRMVLKAYDRVEMPFHVVDLREDYSFTVMHPLSCRPNLFACTTNAWGRETLQRADAPGSYRLDPNPDLADEWILGERVG